MATTVRATEEAPTARDRCPECGIFMGGHRSDCSRLDWRNPAAVAAMREVEAYLGAKGR